MGPFFVQQGFWQYSSDCGFGQTIVLWFEPLGLWLLPQDFLTSGSGRCQHPPHVPLCTKAGSVYLWVGGCLGFCYSLKLFPSSYQIYVLPLSFLIQTDPKFSSSVCFFIGIYLQGTLWANFHIQNCVIFHGKSLEMWLISHIDMIASHTSCMSIKKSTKHQW